MLSKCLMTMTMTRWRWRAPLKLDLHVKTHRADGLQTNHVVPGGKRSATEASIRLPCTQLDWDRGPQGDVGHSSCGWWRKGDVTRTPWHVGCVWYGRSSNLASPPWNFIWIDFRGWQSWLTSFWLSFHGWLSWLTSFLAGRTQQVVFDGMTSIVVALSFGVPQGSVLGPLLFLLYTADIPVIASDHSLGIHCYADDGQLYIFDKFGKADSMISKVTVCISEIDKWMSSNRLKLNSEKTQFIWLGSARQLQKVTVDSITLAGSTMSFQFSCCERSWSVDQRPAVDVPPCATGLPLVVLPASPAPRPSKLSLSLSQQRRVQPWSTPLSQAGWTTAIACLPASTRNFWISWSQYCVRRHALPCENGSSTRYRRHAGYSHILPWLPVRQRIDFKLGILVFKCLRGDDPSYLVESVSSVADQPNRRSHRSATRGDLIVPRTRTVTMGPCSFYVSGSTLWNSLPLELRSYELTLETFMAKLKSHLFQSACIH